MAIVQEPSEALAPSMPLSARAHVGVDHCCALAEMGDLLVMLAHDDLSITAPDAHDELIRIETRIAEGVLGPDEWSAFERSGSPSGFNCPDCRNVLFEVRDERILRFRCRAGHAFSAQSLLALQAETMENQLAALFGSLHEEAMLSRRLLGTPICRDDAMSATLAARIGKAERDAARIWQWMCNSPEPDQQ
ncbi:hypothetical protein BX592_108174 [Paraburkholderia rhizosphaerae]|uniref:Uncharacterized protein n=1 Tax=Paraburkholderia rhizosphaerae TaxID=480658 RepID=A0A4R8LVW9_9BURK|nr:hypothetical protein BX592_108174 [Paraburkholderia rhizosphaerae]